MPVAREVAIPAGGTATATWDLRGGRGTEIEIQNVGSASCEFADHVLHAGKTATVSVRDGTREFALAIRSARGTQVKLVLAAWRAPTLILSKRRVIERDPRTHTISSITEIPCWIEESV
jgi:hypothetical protein